MLITPSNAFDPQIVGGGLSITVQPGSVSINGVVTAIPQTAVALTANTTNYVYVDLNSLAIASNTSGFPGFSFPVAIAVTLTSSIQSLADKRTDLEVVNGGTIAETLNVASQPAYRLMDSELTLGYQGSTTIAGSVAAVRGNTTVAAGDSVVGASYVYGVQGKITNKGTMSGSAEVSAAVLGQLDLSASVALTAPIAALWGDCGASVGTVTGANIDIAVLYNTTSATVNSMIRAYAKASVCFDLSSNGSACLDASSTASGSVIGHILVNINGVAGVLRVYQTS